MEGKAREGGGDKRKEQENASIRPVKPRYHSWAGTQENRIID